MLLGDLIAAGISEDPDSSSLVSDEVAGVGISGYIMAPFDGKLIQ